MMIRKRENPVALRAGVFSLLAHAVFFLLLVMSLSWRVAPPMQVAQVELWDSLPAPKVHPPEPVPEPPEPEPAPKIEPRPEPPPPPPEPKADIQVKPKKPPEPPKPEKKPKAEAPKPDPKLKAREEERLRQEELRKLQQMFAEDDKRLQHEAQSSEAQQAAEARAAQAAAASSGVVDEYKARIVAKIKRFVNPQVCGSGKPVVEFGISLMPTGEVLGAPRLKSGSGIAACDQAVERAILQAQPLPLPKEPELFSQFRELSLKFRPNDNN